MKLSKPEYNENVVDIDGLEKLRIQQEAETDRKTILEQELTKREVIKQTEDTKRGSGYSNRRVTFAVAFAIVLVIATIAGMLNVSEYLGVQKARVEALAPKCPAPPPIPKCPELVCQAVPMQQAPITK